MSLKLQPHQQEAYDNLKQKFDNGRYGVIIFPTGAGKSVVAQKLLEENKDKRVLYLSPYKSINRQFQDYIKRYMQENNKKSYKKSYNSKYEEYLCVDNLGNIIAPDFITKHFKRLLKNSDLKIIRFHDLRHSCASLLLARGIPLKEIQAWLGHSNFNTTANIYAHLDSTSMNESANAISNVLSTDKIKNVLATA